MLISALVADTASMELVGRDAELTALRAAFAEPWPRVVTLSALAGLGKSSLLATFLAGVEGPRVLGARPRETEAALDFTALSELLSTVPEAVYDDLPVPQRAALRGALLLDDPTAAEPRAVAAALRSVVRSLAAERPLLLAIDDVHWLDHASAAALASALRQVEAPVMVIASGRPEGRSPLEWLPPWPRTEVVLRGLDSAEIHEVVAQHLGLALTPAELRTVAEASAGNPLHALELARHRTQGSGTFEALLADRLLQLPRQTRTALATVALAQRPTPEVVSAALGRPVPEVLDSLEPAIRERLVRVGDAIEFRHPLYRVGAADAVADAERRDLHLRLAGTESSAEARVMHRAAARPEPDDVLADELAAAAEEAWRRAARSSATRLMELAVERGLDVAVRRKRTLQLASWQRIEGELAPASEHLRTLLHTELRDEACLEMLLVNDTVGVVGPAAEFARTVDWESMSPELYARAVGEGDLCWALGEDFESMERYEDAWRRLTTVPERPGLDELKTLFLAMWAYRLLVTNSEVDGVLQQAMEYESRTAGVTTQASARIILARRLAGQHRHHEARSAFDALVARATDEGDDAALPFLAIKRAHLAVRAGWWDEVRPILEGGRRAAVATGRQVQALDIERALAHVDALRGGDAERALARLDELTLQLAASGVVWATLPLLARGEILLLQGRPEEAYDVLAAARATRIEARQLNPTEVDSHSCLLDAQIAIGRLDEAAALLDEVRTAVPGHRPLLAELARFDVALLAARGDVDGAVAAVPAMVAGLDDVPDGTEVRPLERAHAWLTAGRVLRRGRRKSEACAALAQALEIYERLGTPPYAAQARAELARVGLRPKAPDTLTSTELEVARLAAEGLRNTEIADRAFLAVKTVEAVLSRVYRKLDIRSRAEVGRALSERGLARV